MNSPRTTLTMPTKRVIPAEWAFPDLHDVQSITKGAIGLCYFVAGVDVSAPLWGCPSVSVADALSHHTGLSDDTTDNLFDFDAFRSKASAGSASDYTVELLKSRKIKPGTFHYSNIMFQLLSKHFKETTSVTCAAVLESLIGSRGWGWETDAEDLPLGPHGLYLAETATHAFGDLLGYYLGRVDVWRPVTGYNKRPYNKLTVGCAYGVFKSLYAGPVIWAAGFNEQYIVVDLRTGATYVSLHGKTKADFKNRPPGMSFVEYVLLDTI